MVKTDSEYCHLFSQDPSLFHPLYYVPRQVLLATSGQMWRFNEICLHCLQSEYIYQLSVRLGGGSES